MLVRKPISLLMFTCPHKWARAVRLHAHVYNGRTRGPHTDSQASNCLRAPDRQVGALVEGRVRSVAPEGVLVQLQGLYGWLDAAELTGAPGGAEPEAVFAEGEAIQVRVVVIRGLHASSVEAAAASQGPAT